MPLVNEQSDLDPALIHQILDTHNIVNDCIYLMYLVHKQAFERDGGDNPKTQATEEALANNMYMLGASIQKFQSTLIEATAVVASGREALASISLRTAAHTFMQWLVAAEHYAKLMLDFATNDVCSQLNLRTKEVDRLCPKWGSCVSDTVLNLEMAEVMLLQSSTTSQIRPALNELWQCIYAVGRFGQAAGLPPVAEHIATREWVSLASNSLAFGKQTVAITAAIRCIVDKRYDQVQLVLKRADVLPKALVDKLKSIGESRPEQDDDDDMESPGAAPESVAPPSIKRKNSARFEPNKVKKEAASSSGRKRK